MVFIRYADDDKLKYAIRKNIFELKNKSNYYALEIINVKLIVRNE